MQIINKKKSNKNKYKDKWSQRKEKEKKKKTKQILSFNDYKIINKIKYIVLTLKCLYFNL